MSEDGFVQALQLQANELPWAVGVVNRPIRERPSIDQIAQRAARMQLDGTALGLGVRENGCFDLGGFQPNQSVVFAVLDTSPTLERLVGERCFSDSEPIVFGAILVVSKTFSPSKTRAIRAPVFVGEQMLFISAYRPGCDISLFVVADGRLTTALYLKLSPHIKGHKPPMTPLLRELARPRYRGLYSYVPVYGAAGWRAARYAPTAYLPTRTCNCVDVGDASFLEIGHLTALQKTTSTGAAFVGSMLNGSVTTRYAPARIRMALAQGGASASPQPLSQEGMCDSVVAGGVLAGYAAVYKGALWAAATDPTPVGVGTALIIAAVGSAAVTIWGRIADDVLCQPLRADNDGDSNDDTAVASSDPSDNEGNDGEGGGEDGMGDAGDSGLGDGGGGNDAGHPDTDPFFLV